MGKVVYSVTASLDGFIAGPGGDVQWLHRHLEPNPDLDGLVGTVGALLVGHRTFGGDDPNRATEREGPFGGAWSGTQVVVTRTPPKEETAGTVFVDDALDGLRLAKEAAGDEDVHVLGAATARAVLDAGELDELLVCVAPVLLGDGTRLFEHPGGREVLLERTRVGTASGTTVLWFRVLR